MCRLILAGLLTSLPLRSVEAQLPPPPVPQTELPPRNIPTINWGDRYILGPGDRLRLDIVAAPEFNGEYWVLPDGSLVVPLVGALPVQGLTLDQATILVSEELSNVLRRSAVNLVLLQARPVTVAIAGEIQHPGAYTLTPNGETGIPSLTQALQSAGGVMQSADLRQVQVRRLNPRLNGGDEVVVINLWRLLYDADLRQDIQLRDGDTIFIPTSTSFDAEVARLLSNSTLRADEAEPIQVAIVGEVTRPGSYTLSQESDNDLADNQSFTVSQAIQTAGGINQQANIRDIEVRRPTRDGGMQTITIDFWALLQGGDLRQDIPLQEGDMVVVPTATALSPEELAAIASANVSPTDMEIYVIGEVAAPGLVNLSPNTPLNQAILAAGGFNRSRARRGTVQLVRLNPDGTVLRQDIDVDLENPSDLANNPALRPGDAILVGRSGLASFSDTVGLLLTPFTGVTSVLRLLGL